jgi:hypothetical protein
MRTTVFELLFLMVFISMIFAGCTWFDEEPEYAEGFDESEIAAPDVPSYQPHDTLARPEENASQLAPGFAYNLSWSMADIYSLWGGFISISCENSGVNDIFVYRYGIIVNWSMPSEWIYEEHNVLVPVGEERQLGIVYITPPDITGNFSYEIMMSIMVKDNELYDEHGVESWFENGTVRSKGRELVVKPLAQMEEIDIISNYKHYSDKVNDRVVFEGLTIHDIIQDITSRYPGEYNIYQVLAIYDYILNDLSYIPDPEERDYWCNPFETIGRGGGDCEDFSILFSSLTGALGGTTRIHLTQTHAFSVLYIGNTSTKNYILEAIEQYYGTSPNFVLYKDDLGYWIAADPAGSWYMGGLPADATPSLVSTDPTVYDFVFDNTTKIHVIDVTG